MTVKELKATLEEYDDDDLVVLSRDSEGNGYSPLSQHGGAWYRPDTTWSGDLLDDDEDEPDTESGDVHTVVLWPRN
jgi:hypothetical protein